MSRGMSRKQRMRATVTATPAKRTRKTKPMWRRTLTKAWKWMCERAAQARVARKERSLRICETAALGDKRFIAVVQFEDERFLIGGAAGSVSLLARLGAGGEFSATLDAFAGPAALEPSTIAEFKERMAG